MSEHVIVCGMGDVGYRVVELLHRLGEAVFVVTADAREERRLAAEARDVRVLLGDARNERLLLAAGLASAKAVIAATDQDLVNLEVALDARRHRPDVAIVIRLFDPDLARQLEQALDVRRALGMAALAAPSFAAAALGESVLASFSLGETPFVVGRQTVGEGALQKLSHVGAIARLRRLHPLLRERPGAGCEALPGEDLQLQPGDRLSLLGRKKDWDSLFGPGDGAEGRRDRTSPWRALRRALARTFGIWRDEPMAIRAVFAGLCLLIPLTVFLFHFYLGMSITDAIYFTVTNLHGEIGLTTNRPEIKLYEVLLMILGSITVATLYSMITDYLVSSRLRKLLGGRAMPRRGHVIVAGLGRVGYRVVRELTAMGVPVVAIDSNPGASLLASARAVAPVITADARSAEILSQAGLAKARAVVAATSDDAANLSIGLAAKRLSPKIRAVVRLFDAELARKVESTLGIDAAMGASRIAAPTFVASALYSDVAKAVIVQDDLLVLLHRKAGDWAGKTPSQLRAEQGLHVILRNGDLTSAREAATDEQALGPEEEVLAALSRRLAPAWSEAVSTGNASSPPG